MLQCELGSAAGQTRIFIESAVFKVLLICLKSQS